MKFFISFILVLSTSFISSAQDSTKSNPKPDYILVRIGSANPIENFKDNGNKPSSGAAEKGINFEFGYRKYISNNTSWILTARLSSNKIDKAAIDEEIKSQFPINTTFTSSVGKWNTTTIMTGFATDIPLKGNLIALRLRLLGGYAMASSPNINISATNNNVVVNSIQERGKSRGFGVVTGADLVLNAKENISFTLGIQYYYTDTDFDDIDVRTTSNTGFSQLQTTRFNQEIRIIGLELSLQFRL